MRDPIFLAKAPKRTVSLTINSDLYEKAKSLGINASRVAEEALANAYAATRAESIRAELQQDLAAADNYAEMHGSFSEIARAHYELEDGAI